MSRFFSKKYSSLTPYTPGEQPKDQKYVKLNTNESPFPPSEKAQKMAAEALKNLHLYPDPDCRSLTESLANLYGIQKDEILWTNGSDDVLNFAFMAFCDDENSAVFPDLTYGFYSVFAKANSIPYETIPLRDDFTIDVNCYLGNDKTIFIANPNAPTGIPLKREEIEKILKANPDRVVVIDEAYVDFGAESCVPLIHTYDNLLVTQTFSKSRSMAGARLGMGIASKELIADLNTIKYSTNPYCINSATMAAGIGSISDQEYFLENCNQIIKNRAYTSEKLQALGFEMTPSSANFIFVKHPDIAGQIFYDKLKEYGVLVRHWNTPRIADYCRVTIGSKEQMDAFLSAAQRILEELV